MPLGNNTEITEITGDYSRLLEIPRMRSPIIGNAVYIIDCLTTRVLLPTIMQLYGDEQLGSQLPLMSLCRPVKRLEHPFRLLKLAVRITPQPQNSKLSTHIFG